MKRKIFTAALLIVGALSFTACSEDETMNELIQDTELNSVDSDGDGDDDDKEPPVGG